jgi:DNA replication licensing factor MCM2
MLESFLQAQKVSVRKTLQRSFRKYVTYGEESNQLLMHQLQNLITEVEKYKMVSQSAADISSLLLTAPVNFQYVST